ncbi:MAG: GNAT family N-acetyltransferase, partial [Pseudomonadota bacterium]
MPDFRAMSAADLREVVMIERACVEFPWATAHFESSLRNEHSCQVLQLGQTVIAYAIVMFAASEATLLNICVAQEYQKQGYGEQMLSKMIDIARHEKAESMFLEVRDSN